MNTKPLIVGLLAVLPLWVSAQQPAAPAGASKKEPAAPAAVPDAAAELTLVTGSVTVSTAAAVRALGKGDQVFVGDTLAVGPNSYANLKFPDGGRVLLRPNTDFTVEAYKFTALVEEAPSTPQKSKTAAPPQQAFFKLLRGGFRAVSGLIGKNDQQSYRVTTPVATIGIRGTDYEVQICAEDCPTDVPKKAGLEDTQLASTTLAGLELAQAGGSSGAPQGGLLLATNEGTVVMKTGRGEYLVKVGEVAFALSNGQVLMLPAVPDALLPYSGESPENCE